jgi:hypothetical protein
MSKPSGFSYGWSCRRRGALIPASRSGRCRSQAVVFLPPDFAKMGWSRSGVSGGGHDRLSRDGTGGIFLGRTVRPVWYPHRRMIRLAAAGAGLIGASQATSLWQFHFSSAC